MRKETPIHVTLTKTERQRLIASVVLGQREAMIVALSLGVGLGLPTQRGLTAGIPEIIRAVFESGISAGGLTAMTLTAVWPARR